MIYPPLMAISASYARLEEDALHLPYEERSLLASKLLESLDEPTFEPSPEWREELQRRAKEIDDGKARMIPAAEVWSRINQRFGGDL